MTDLHEHGEHGHAHGGARSEEDRVPTGSILFVGIASLVLFFLASAGAVSYLRVRQGERPPLPIPPEVGRSKIGMVEQQLFEVAVRGERDRAVRLERLRSYGWVDRGAGVAHVPIDRAMELVVRGVRPAPGPTPAQEERRIPGGQP
jgi:hypothetical protein